MDISGTQVDLYQVVGTLLGIAAITVFQRAVVWFNRHIGGRTADVLAQEAPFAVHAAEELGRELSKHGAPASSEEKLEYATAKLRELAKLGHIKLTDDQAEVIIKGALNQMRSYMEPEIVEAQVPTPPPTVFTAPRPIKDNPQA